MNFGMNSQPIAVLLLLFLYMSISLFVGANDYTAEERKVLQKFRPMVAKLLYRDFMEDETYLIPILRARKMDLAKAKEMLEKDVEWRKANKIDTILKEDFSEMEKAFPVIADGKDKWRRPVLIVLAGQYNFRKVVLSGQTEQFNRYLDRNFELARAFRTRNNVTQGVMIMDLYGFNRKTHACLNCIQIFVHFARTYEDHYPELCHKFYFVNAPTAFQVVDDVIRPLRTPASIKAYNLFGHNKDEWQKVILNDIDPDQLPARFGGTKITKFVNISSLIEAISI